MTSVHIVGAGIHRFGRCEGMSALDQGVAACRSALGDAGLDWSAMQFGFGGSRDGGNADAVMPRLGLTGAQFINVANGCATGGSALLSAYWAIKSGEFDLGIVVGFDKHARGSFNPDPARWGLPEWYGKTGLMLTTQFFGLKTQRYMALHGIDPATLGRVAQKAFRNGVLTDHAWRREEIALEAILGSDMVSDPLTKFMFCAPSEGAVAVIVASDRKMRELGLSGPKLRGAAVRTRLPGSFEVFSPSLQVAQDPPLMKWQGLDRRTSIWRSCRIPIAARKSCTWPKTAFARMAIRWRGWPKAALRPMAPCPSTPMAAALPVASRLAHRACARSMKTCSNCAVALARGKFPARASATARSTAHPAYPQWSFWKVSHEHLHAHQQATRRPSPRDQL